MKYKLPLNFTLAGLLLFSISLTAANWSFAEDADSESDQKVSLLESQMASLIETQEKLTLALENTLDPQGDNQDFKNVDPEPQQLGGDGTNFPPNSICINDHEEWPSSLIYNEAPWSMQNIALGNTGYGFLDVNGDGLQDYYNHYATNQIRQTCVNLNTGSGWQDLAYKCYAKRDDYDNNGTQEWKFWGDCAKQ